MIWLSPLSHSQPQVPYLWEDWVAKGFLNVPPGPDLLCLLFMRKVGTVPDALRFCHCPNTPKSEPWVMAPSCSSLSSTPITGGPLWLAVSYTSHPVHQPVRLISTFPNSIHSSPSLPLLPWKILNNHKLTEKLQKYYKELHVPFTQLALTLRISWTIAWPTTVLFWTPSTLPLSVPVTPPLVPVICSLRDNQRHCLFF